VPTSFQQARFYDFNVWTAKKRVEKLRYMHRNPVTRRLVASPDQWRWSSVRAYALGEEGIVAVNAIYPPKWANTGATELSFHPDEQNRLVRGTPVCLGRSPFKVSRLPPRHT
jgi:hypothetical protein